MSKSGSATSTAALLIKPAATILSAPRHDRKSMAEAGKRDAASLCESMLGTLPEGAAIDMIYSEAERRAFNYADAGAPLKVRMAYLASFHAEVKSRYAKFLGV